MTKWKKKVNLFFLPFDPCVLHKTYVGFDKGILQYGQDVEHLSFELYSWFKITPCKREGFMQVAVEFQNEIIFSYLKEIRDMWNHVG